MSSMIHTPKQFWSTYHSLTPNKERIPHILTDGTTTAESAVAKANLLNTFFASCFTHPNPCKEPPPLHSPISPPDLPCIQCSEEEVAHLLRTLKAKTSTGPDTISSQMLRNTASSIAPSLTKLFNLSLSSGTLPAEWKASNITPVYKAGDKNLVSNYRPISLLSIPFKVLERIVHNRLLHHLLSNSILSPRQFGFRPCSSTQEALLMAIHDWQRCLDLGLSSAALFLDMSKAFDKVPHHSLLLSLAKIGVSGSLLQWLENYLTNRTQRVVLSGSSSTSLPVQSGVPQGSILGPLLFIIYINSLAEVHLSPGSSLILYADDILLYRPIVNKHDHVLLQQDVDLIASWINSSGLSNPKKSTLLILSRKQVKPQLHLSINSTPIRITQSVKYLGVTITSDLKWSLHILHSCNSAKRKLGLLYRNFYQADQRTLTHLYKALVLPKLDYCSCVWDPSSSSLTAKLEAVQRFAAKLCSKQWSGDSHSLVSSLGWPSLQSRRLRQKAMLCRRIICGESIISPSPYFSPLPHINPRIHHRHSVKVPYARTAAYQHSFFLSASRLWNSLPPDMVSLSSLSFKRALLSFYD